MHRGRSVFQFIIAEVHLWLGLVSGLIVVILCLTGSIYAFKSQIEDLVNDNVVFLEADRESFNPDEFLQNLQTTGSTLTSFRLPADLNRAIPIGLTDSSGNRQQLFADPTTSDIQGQKDAGTIAFFRWMFRAHRWLLLDASVGRPITGAATVIFLVILLSGIILWVPKKMIGLKKALTVKWKSGWKRLNFDLHTVLGFYAMILLFVMGATGLSWSYDWFDNAVYTVLDGNVPERKRVEYLSDTNQASNTVLLSSLLARTNKEFPYRGDIDVRLPSEKDGSIYIGKTRNEGTFQLPYREYIRFDQYTGEILQLSTYSEKTRAEKFFAILKPLHMGYVYGNVSLILYFVACLLGTSFPITGVIIWINKLKARRRKPTPIITRSMMTPSGDHGPLSSPSTPRRKERMVEDV